jgi:hypothetical protein
MMLPLIGRAGEISRLRDSLRNRRSLMVLGMAGSGKTALLRAIAEEEDFIYLRYSKTLHQLLVDLAGALLEPGSFEEQTSVHLKGLLWAALEAEPRAIAVDGIDRASFPTYRFFQRLYFVKGVSLIATAKDAISLGALGRLFWDPRSILHLDPLQHADAARLFDRAADQFGLRDLDIQEFRDKVLGSAKGNPGQIVEMCRMASNPIYVSGKHIKFAPLRIDAVTRFLA